MFSKCMICDEHDARYICKVCGRSVCGNCFLPQKWICTDCLSEMVSQMDQRIDKLTGYQSNWLLRLTFIGFIIVFIGMVFMMVSTLLSGGGQVSGGVVIFIGPIPIVLGSSPFALPVVLIIILMTIGLIFFLITRKR